MIALFARANHPRQGWSFAHGYVVVGVRCSTLQELEAVKKEVGRRGLRLPDKYRVSHLPGGEVIDWSVHEWYSGGVGAFDYLATFDGDSLDETYEGDWGSKGDNRFFWVFDAAEVV